MARAGEVARVIRGSLYSLLSAQSVRWSVPNRNCNFQLASADLCPLQYVFARWAACTVVCVLKLPLSSFSIQWGAGIDEEIMYVLFILQRDCH